METPTVDVQALAEVHQAATDAVNAQVAPTPAETDKRSLMRRLADSVASYYAKLTSNDSTAALIVADLALFIRIHKATDKEVAEVLRDSHPKHQIDPQTRYLKDGTETWAVPSKAKPSGYRQYAALWRDLADIENGDWGRDKWSSTADTRLQLAAGVRINNRVYFSPTDALAGKDGPNPLRKVWRAYLDILKPKVENLGDIPASEEKVAFAQAETVKVKVKVFDKEMNRYAPKMRQVAGTVPTFCGVVTGLVAAAQINGLTLTSARVAELTKAIGKLEAKTVKTSK